MMGGPENSPTQDSKIKGALCYFPFIGWIISIFFILTEREDHYVRFNALQSLMLLIFFVVISVFFNQLTNLTANMIYVGLVIGLIDVLLSPFYLLVSLFLIYKGYSGERVMLPRLGVAAENHM
jgi:uncharacterized membrane protein